MKNSRSKTHPSSLIFPSPPLSSKRGFTLIELLVAISIIILLASVIVINFASSRAKSRDARRKSDSLLLASALESYYVENKKYPTGCITTETAQKNINAVPKPELTELINKGFLTTLPVDPKNPAVPYIYVSSNYWKTTAEGLQCIAGAIDNTPSATQFVILVALERENDPDAKAEKYFPPLDTTKTDITRQNVAPANLQPGETPVYTTFNYWVTSR